MLGVDVARAAAGERIFSAIAAGNQDTLQEIVRGLRMHATTVAGVATSQGIARNPRRRGSKSATTVARPATWPVIVTMPMSRSVTHVEALDTFRKAARKSSATGAVRSVMLPCSAARRARSTATTAENLATWRKSAPSRPPLNPVSLFAPPFSD